MGNRVMEGAPRKQRRLALDRERRLRKTGEWGPWECLSLRSGTVCPVGWAAEMTAAYRNGVFCVLARTLADGTRHFMISSLTEERPSWWEAQRIKNELAGPEATAVEVYPPQGEVIDEANAYHLWVLPNPLPFSLFDPALAERAA